MEITPESMISDLDEALELAGTNVKLRRLFGTNRVPVEIDIKAVFRKYDANEMVGDIQQTDQMFIMSPTEVTNGNWPGYHNNEPGDRDLRVPRKNDKLITEQGVMNVEECKGIFVQDVLVRIDGRVRG